MARKEHCGDTIQRSLPYFTSKKGNTTMLMEQNMKIGNIKIIRRSLQKNGGNNVSFASISIRNRKKLLTFKINSYTLYNPP